MTHDDIHAQLLSLLAVDIAPNTLSEKDTRYLRDNMHRLHAVEEIWQAMDAEWVAHGAGFEEQKRELLDRFYESPVWLLNGIFTEIDPVSQKHRRLIRDFVAQQKPAVVTDYGGGFGALARRVAQAVPTARVVVVEPFPSSLALTLASQYRNLSYESELPPSADVVVAQDVLEHVTDPLSLFATLLSSVRIDGIIIVANCFQPVIFCHYPGAFHFHFTFPRIVPHLGCRFIGAVSGVPHAHVFRKISDNPDWRTVRRLERLSRASYPLLRLAQQLKQRIAGPRQPE